MALVREDHQQISFLIREEDEKRIRNDGDDTYLSRLATEVGFGTSEARRLLDLDIAEHQIHIDNATTEASDNLARATSARDDITAMKTRI